LTVIRFETGEVLWPIHEDGPKPRPMHSLRIRDGKLIGLIPHAGQGFYFAVLDCRTGRARFAPCEQTGYGGRPEVVLAEHLYGNCAVAMLKDRQDFEIIAFDRKAGKLVDRIKVKGIGDFGEHGRVSATVQNGNLALLGKNDLRTTLGK
jgi:hypothetical protein